MNKTSIFIVQAEHPNGCSKIYGAYPTEALALARCYVLTDDDNAYGLEYAWFDEVVVGPDGGDYEFTWPWEL